MLRRSHFDVSLCIWFVSRRRLSLYCAIVVVRVSSGRRSLHGSSPLRAAHTDDGDHNEFDNNNGDNDFGSHLLLDNISISSVSPVPEPGTYAMMLAGLAMLCVAARRRQMS